MSVCGNQRASLMPLGRFGVAAGEMEAQNVSGWFPDWGYS